VHTNTNRSSAIERHITLLLPELANRPFDIEFEAKGPADRTNGAGEHEAFICLAVRMDSEARGLRWGKTKLREHL
jgi:hypothetical protein